MPADSIASTHGAAEKLHWEVEKLRAETRNLQRPTLLSPTTLIALTTAAVGLIGAGFQYQINQVRADKADLAAAQNSYRAELARSELERLEKTKSELAGSIDAMQAENKKVSDRLADVRNQLAKAEEGIQVAAANVASPEAKQALAEARSTVAALRTETSASEKVQTDRAARLSAIRRDVLKPAVSNLRLVP